MRGICCFSDASLIHFQQSFHLVLTDAALSHTSKHTTEEGQSAGRLASLISLSDSLSKLLSTVYLNNKLIKSLSCTLPFSH